MGLSPHQSLSPSDQRCLLALQRQALAYFLDNQTPTGLILDRQSNHGPRRAHGLCSLAATGMGFIALALATAPPYRLLSRRDAAQRTARGARDALERLPHDRGVVPHFVHSATGEAYGSDAFSTIETAWLVAGTLWAADFLGGPELARLADRLYHRIDWMSWARPGDGLLRHGRGADGRLLNCAWDRLNGETVFLYVLALGAAGPHALSPRAWNALRPPADSAGLGLFVFQYGLDLLDAPGLWAAAAGATASNREACRQHADRFATYRRFWGLSAGDGPGDRAEPDAYRAYAPAGPIDGTAHLTATLAAVAHDPGAVLENVYEADGDRTLSIRGRYGFSPVNLDRRWVGRDMVGIDAGAAVLALDNFLANGRVRSIFHGLECVGRGLRRAGCTPPAPSRHRAA